MIDNTQTGSNIASCRQKLGWTQDELARPLNVTHQAVSKWENGLALPDISTLYELSRLFGTTMETMLTGDVTAAPTESEAEHADSPAPHDALTPASCETPGKPDGTAVGPAVEPPMPSADWDQIISLAPFASGNTLDKLIALCEESCDYNRIIALAPFLSSSTLDRLIQSALTSADWNQIIALAPFASRHTLDKLIALCEEVCDYNRIIALAPFLSRDTLERLIFSRCSQLLQEQPPISNPARSAERSVYQAEKMAEKAARQAEKAAERAARLAERQAKQFCRRYERQLEQAFDAAQMAQSISDRVSEALSSSARRTEIRDISPSAETLIEYANETLSLLYAARDSEDSAAGQFEEIHSALLNQDYAALNEFAPLLDRCLGPQWLEEYAALCSITGEIPDDSDSQPEQTISPHAK